MDLVEIRNYGRRPATISALPGFVYKEDGRRLMISVDGRETGWDATIG